MLVNVNPTEADAGESACSLGFAARVRGVELGPAKKQIEAGAGVQELRSQLSELQQQVFHFTDIACDSMLIGESGCCTAVMRCLRCTNRHLHPTHASHNLLLMLAVKTGEVNLQTGCFLHSAL